MNKSANLLATTQEKVLSHDMQILFGKSMKSSSVIEELLPVHVLQVEQVAEGDADGLDSLENWLEGLTDE